MDRFGWSQGERAVSWFLLQIGFVLIGYSVWYGLQAVLQRDRFSAVPTSTFIIPSLRLTPGLCSDHGLGLLHQVRVPADHALPSAARALAPAALINISSS